jgi:membrane protein involved in colicin uptake
LAQHLGEDPLPLRRAKITNEAAVKKAERTAKAAAEARAAAEAAMVDAAKKVDEAEKYLKEVSSRPGSAAGALWWIERELHEARAYLPTAKGGYKKEK